MREALPVLACVLLLGCQKSTTMTASDAGCDVSGFAAEVAEVGARAARGEPVVAPGGCSVLDGVALSRGFPTTADEVRAALEAGPGCTPQLNAKGRRIRLERRGGKLVVVEVRMSERPGEPPSLGDPGSLLRAARCPEPAQRLRTAEDEGALQAYALAAAALRAALEAAGGSGDGAPGEARATLARICENHVATAPTPEGPAAPPAPLAAAAQLMAVTFTTFNDAAKEIHSRDVGIRAVGPAARDIAAHPLRTNRDGVCALNRLTEAVMTVVDERRRK